MRLLVAAIGLLCTTVQAQPILPALRAQTVPLAVAAEPASARAREGARVGVGVVGLAGGLAASLQVVLALGSDADTPRRVTLVVLAYPVGATLTMQGLQRLLGDRVPLLHTGRDVALGMVASTVVGGIVGATGVGIGYLVEQASAGGSEYVRIGPVVGGLVGGAAGVITLVWVSTRSVRLAPAALAAPTGERALGLSVRVGL